MDMAVGGNWNVCNINRGEIETRYVFQLLRMYNFNIGEHFYTGSQVEKNNLNTARWNYKGVAFNFAYDTKAVQHWLHNSNNTRGAYHFTASVEERDSLLVAGWEYQSIDWYSLGV